MTVVASTFLLEKGLPSLTKSTLNPYAPVAKWILGTSSLVVGMVHIGGVTRLTKSGLSMTDWKPLGSLPPQNIQEWNIEFDRYKSFPEWQQRQSMTLHEFQYIYYWEWGHRMLGRVVGVAFALPWAYFAFRKKIPSNYSNRMKVLFAMGGTQGLVGWWMVKSGLGEDRFGDRKEIRVSPYRLTAHLTMAFSTYSLLLWTGLGLLQYPNDYSIKNAATGHTISSTSSNGNRNRNGNGIQCKGTVKLVELTKSLSSKAIQHAKQTRAGAMAVTSLTALTVISGAFVAGNDAGNAYNTFPKMDDQWIPMDDMIDSTLLPTYRNAFENTAMVQWNHRMLGTSTALSAIGCASFGLLARRRGVHVPSSSSSSSSLSSLTPQVKNGLKLLGGVAVGQMSLGIATLLNYVPITLAAAHQIGSLIVLSSGIYVVHSLRYVSPGVLRLVGKQVVTNVAKSGGSAANGASGVVAGAGAGAGGGGAAGLASNVLSKVV